MVAQDTWRWNEAAQLRKEVIIRDQEVAKINQSEVWFQKATDEDEEKKVSWWRRTSGGVRSEEEVAR